MLGTQRKSSKWFIPFCFISALLGVILSTGYSPVAAQLSVQVAQFAQRYDTSSQMDYGKQFQRVLDAIRNNSVNAEAVESEEKLFNIAIDAILKEIGDTHGRYLSVEEWQRLNDDMRPANYTGVGIQISPGAGGALILNIFDNSPLNNMGVRVGDLITAAGSLGEPMVEYDPEDLMVIVTAIKGPAGTDVILNIKRGTTNLPPITVPRIVTRNQYVFMKLSETGVLTIRITSFSGTIYGDIKSMLLAREWLIRNDILDTSIIKGVVLDLRGNPGGVLGQAVYVSDLFLSKDVVAVRVIQRPEIEGGPPVAYNYLTDNGRMFPADIPRVILINGGSASASEIVAGAVQTHKEGLIMGIKSYGKGSVQSVIELPGGTGIKTTSAIYFAGGTMEIDGIGVMPDVVVLQPDPIGLSADDKSFNGHLIRISMDPEMDHQLNVAHTYINSFISGEHVLDVPESRQAAENKAHGAKTELLNICEAKGLRGCPPVDFTYFENIDYGMFLSDSDAAGWLCYPDEVSSPDDTLAFLDNYSLDSFFASTIGWKCSDEVISFALE
jgi:carboxyl-terminal processing protease